MHLLIYGPGRLGGAVARAAADEGWAATLIGRPDPGSRRATAPLADVVVEASAGGAVAANLAHALGTGNRRFIIAASAWDADTARVRSLLLEHGAAAVVAPNLALGAALFLRLAEQAAAMYARGRVRAVDRGVASTRQGGPSVRHGAPHRPPDHGGRPPLGRARRA